MRRNNLLYKLHTILKKKKKTNNNFCLKEIFLKKIKYFCKNQTLNKIISIIIVYSLLNNDNVSIKSIFLLISSIDN